MDLWNEFEKILIEFKVPYVIDGHSIIVKPKDDSGFEVKLRDEKDFITVNLEGWDEDFEDIGLAMDCFLLALTDHCRLLVSSCGGKPWKWTRQIWKDETWAASSPVYYPFSFHFWRKQETITLQNRTIPHEVSSRWYWVGSLKPTVMSLIKEGRLEVAREMLLSLLEETEKPLDGSIREDIQEHLLLINNENDISSLFNIESSRPLEKIELGKAEEIAKQCADAIDNVHTYQSSMKMKEPESKYYIEYSAKVAKPDRFHISRAVRPEGDYDEWITIGKQHWRMPFGLMPDLFEKETEETKSLLVERFSSTLRKERPKAAYIHKFKDTKYDRISYDLDYIPGAPPLNQSPSTSVQADFWITKHDNLLVKILIRAEVREPDDQIEHIEIEQCFAEYDLDINISPPTDLLLQGPPGKDVTELVDNSAQLKQTSLLKVVFLSIITLGIYIPFWYLKRVDDFNRLNSEEKLGKKVYILCIILQSIAIIMLFFKIGVAYLTGHLPGGEDPSSTVTALFFIPRMLKSLVTGIIIFETFRIKRILIDHFGDSIKMSKILTFIFVNFYLQYKINRMKEKKWIHDYTEAINKNSKDIDAYYNRGIAFGEIGHYTEAIQDFTKIIELDPKDEDVYYSRGAVHGKLGKHTQAIQDFTKAIELDPGYVEAYSGRGANYGEQGNYTEAIQDFTKAIELDPKYVNAYYSRGIIYIKLGKHTGVPVPGAKAGSRQSISKVR